MKLRKGEKCDLWLVRRRKGTNYHTLKKESPYYLLPTDSNTLTVFFGTHKNTIKRNYTLKLRNNKNFLHPQAASWLTLDFW